MGKLGCVALLLMAGIASAEDTGPPDQVHGFVAPGRGELSGRVTDGRGNPVKHATVHVVTKQGVTVLTTDAEGNYRANVDGQATLVVVHGDAQISGSTVTSEVVAGSEAIHVKDVVPPAKLAKALADPGAIPEYTAEAIDKNAWTRAWLLVEVSATGAVSRVKLLDRPGFDLDAIAIREAFKLTFEPARDHANKPIRTQMLWSFEWPAFWWMNDNHLSRRRLPFEVRHVPCRGTGPTHHVYRDCSPPNLVAAITARWIERSK